MPHPEDRRTHRTLRETLTFTKEIPLVWLITFLLGGLANFAAIVWMAAVLVTEVSALKDDGKLARSQLSAIWEALGTHATELRRQSEVDNALDLRLKESAARIDRLEDRFNKERDRGTR